MSQNLNLTNAEILRAIGLVAGIGRTAANWDAASLQDARDIIRSGLRKFFNALDQYGAPYAWKFLERTFFASGSPTYSTGTVAVSAGTVTLTGGTFPAYAEDCIFRCDGTLAYVTDRVGDTSLTISNDGIAVTAGATYELVRWRYPLPEDFAEFIEGVIYDSGSNRAYRLRSMSDQDIRLRWATNYRTTDTSLYAVMPGVDGVDTARWYIGLWPGATENASLTSIYRTHPFDKLDDADLTADGSVVQVPAVHAETVLAAIQSSAEEFYNDPGAVHTKRYQERLAASIAHDRHSKGFQDITRDFPEANPAVVSLLYTFPTYD